MGEILQTQSKMVTDAEDPSSLSQCEVCQSTSKVRAVCGSSARTDLFGGRPVMAVPTAILFTDAIATDRLSKSLDHHAQMELSAFYHALNRGNLRATIFHKKGDYVAFEKILGEGLELYQIELLCYDLMPNHYHLVLRPLVNGELSRFMKWIGGTHTLRYHAHYLTQGLGHV